MTARQSHFSDSPALILLLCFLFLVVARVYSLGLAGIRAAATVRATGEADAMAEGSGERKPVPCLLVSAFCLAYQQYSTSLTDMRGF